jgi:hypothetical protein
MSDPILVVENSAMPEYPVELPQDIASSFVVVVHQAIVDWSAPEQQ